jgi:hypothetical protein
MLDQLIDRIESEPVLVTTFIGAVIDLAIVFGAPITNDQKVAVGVALTALLAFFARSKVTPV